ncbi:MAG TPA: hypothetical protein VKV39_17945 [Candidatus Sulfotelmatobacter sp.]|nr:hypothetical protein [Candidatus Sulfotelmatobacter sp.]
MPKKPDVKPKEPPVASTAQAPKAPKPETPTPAQQPASKQLATVAKLKAAWTEKGINLDHLTERQDGKFTLLQPTPEWPIVRVGPTGGIELPEIRSYAKAWDAALDGLAVYKKQQARDAKKQASTPKPAPTSPAPLHQWLNRKRLRRGRRKNIAR